MLTLVTCPTCHHKFSIAEGSMGQRSTCPNCQAIFVAGKSVAESNGAAGGASRRGLLERAGEEDRAAKLPIDKTMLGEVAAPIRYNCPRCKKPLESPASEAGTKKPCPSCGGRLQVPAAPPPGPATDPGLNKTLLAEGSYSQPAASSPISAATSPAAAPAASVAGSNRKRNYAIGGLAAAAVVLAVLYFVGKHNADVEHDRLLQAQKMELEKLKADIELKSALLQQQQQLDAKQRRQWEEDRAKQEARQKELDRERENELKRLATLNDQKLAAEAKAKLDQKQRELEEERKAAAEQRLRSEREMRDQLTSIKRELNNANNRSTTIIQQPPVVYPWYHHYYRHPWGW